ncbi:CocE/NonD family hydrolase [Bailinhaonella thermotolerans]|uniref:Acyl esterase n=1 Tax=Bailinhaonella thermotolerans TaxID=1070861 RepID=A0A3A4A3B1_9ACTN|nr:CocE/NonD family hydrolase [Bailinhaonella thermotolerans]RJL21254.1 acyl esterase [Bailinhaonella thermotolerans]
MSNVRYRLLRSALGMAAKTSAASPGLERSMRHLLRVAVRTPHSWLRFTDITARDGVILRAHLYQPRTPGPHPLVIMPSSWAMNDLEYLLPARRLAAHGHIVLSFNTRGFWGSQGLVDAAGPDDVADVSDVITWGLTHTDADPSRVGILGASYGGGLGLLAAARDERVKAVGAMSAWADLTASLLGDDAPRRTATVGLKVTVSLTGRASPSLTAQMDDLLAGRNIEALKAWGDARSAARAVHELNRRDTAVFLAHTWGDSLFPPNQIIDFYQRLTGPKRLELRPGNHLTLELSGILGRHSPVWESATGWLNDHLLDRDARDRTHESVYVQARGAVPEEHHSWQDVAPRSLTLRLGPLPDGRLGDLLERPHPDPAAVTLHAGTKPSAGGALLHVPRPGQAPERTVPGQVLDPADPASAAWTSGPLDRDLILRGAPRLRLPVATGPGRAGLVAYLYDVAPDGRARAITGAPCVFTPGPGVRALVRLDLQATAWTVPAGHALMLLLTGSDPRYTTFNAPGRLVHIRCGAEATLTLPLRE